MVDPLMNGLSMLKPETAHKIATWGVSTFPVLQYNKRLYEASLTLSDLSKLSRDICAMSFTNPVGIAAGLDKTGKLIRWAQYIGAGHIEVGTIVPEPQIGNPKPRMFRLREHAALINRMGFNSPGVSQVRRNIIRERQRLGAKKAIIIGGNIGKNKETAEKDASLDYFLAAHGIADVVDYVSINVSSPNTPGLRNLQHGEYLREIIGATRDGVGSKETIFTRYKPIAVKIAPDMSDDEVVALCKICAEMEVDIIIATNTTLSREGVEPHKNAAEAGGLSGKPLQRLSRHVTKVVRDNWDGVLVSVGGIDSPEEVQYRLSECKADLVQMYTALAYQGPSLIRNVARGIIP